MVGDRGGTGCALDIANTEEGGELMQHKKGPVIVAKTIQGKAN